MGVVGAVGGLVDAQGPLVELHGGGGLAQLPAGDAQVAEGDGHLNGGEPKSRPSPPSPAEKLLLFALPPRISDPIIGDLAERFPSIRERHGDWFARAWYWRHAVGSTCRFLVPRLTGAFSLGAVLRIARRFLPL